jgi:hypothetical protein
MPVPPRILTVTIGLSGTGGMQFSAPTMIEVETEHDAAAKPNSAKIKIHNLAPGELAWIESGDMVAQIAAGDGIASQIFLGDVRRRQIITESSSSGGIVTNIEARDGYRRWIDSTFSRSYPPGTSSDLVLSDALAALRLPIGYRSPGIIPIVFTGGYSFSGKARDCISELVAGWVGTWSVQRGSVYIFAAHDATLPGASPILSAETGLMGSPKRKDRGGVSVVCRLQPAFNKIWAPFTLTSRWINGVFKVSKISHKAKSDGSTWQTELEGIPVTT